MRWFLSRFRTINSLDGGSRGEGEGNYEIKEIFYLVAWGSSLVCLSGYAETSVGTSVFGDVLPSDW